MTTLTTKERKKEFDNIFKEKILPFFQNHGFSRHTKTSKRLFKNFENDLSVFIFLEYKSRFESYDISVVYFDEELGNVYDDNYLALANLKLGSFSGNTSIELSAAADHWLNQLEVMLIPFIKDHTTHKEILASKQFYETKARNSEIMELLHRKSKR